jgi:hypothetical protein
MAIERATENTEDNMQQDTTDNALVNTVESTQDNILPKTSVNILEKVMKSDNKEKGGNHTFYLSADVAEALNKYAKKAKKSKSTFVNDILREVLIN